jgi:hypothetical protein
LKTSIFYFLVCHLNFECIAKVYIKEGNEWCDKEILYEKKDKRKVYNWYDNDHDHDSIMEVKGRETLKITVKNSKLSQVHSLFFQLEKLNSSWPFYIHFALKRLLKC